MDSRNLDVEKVARHASKLTGIDSLRLKGTFSPKPGRL